MLDVETADIERYFREPLRRIESVEGTGVSALGDALRSSWDEATAIYRHALATEMDGIIASIRLPLGALGGDHPSTTVSPDEDSRFPSAFVQALVAFARTGDIDSGLELMFDSLDDQICDGQFMDANRTLRLVNVQQLPVEFLIGLLTVTLRDKDKLTHRPSFFNEVSALLVGRMGQVESSKLLQGLE